MTEGKKDVLEFPLETLEVPAAIKLMMSEATKCYFSVGNVNDDGVIVEKKLVNEERLLLLSEKLEARVEDAIDAAKTVRTEAVAEDAPNDEVVEEGDIFLMQDGEVLNYKGVLYMKMCNEPVFKGGEHTDRTFCVKQWGHQNRIHEDFFGNEGA